MTRSNDFTWVPAWPKRSHKGEPGKRAARTCTKPTSGHNLAFLIRARSPGHTLARTTHPNVLTRTTSNDQPEQFYMGTRTTEMKPQGRAKQRSYTNMHKANLGSQLSIFDMGLFARVRPHPNDPPERVDMDTLKWPTRTSWHGRPQTTCSNDFTWAPAWPKRRDKGEPGKWAARTCTKPTSGDNLAFLIWAHSPRRTLDWMTFLNELTQMTSKNPT